LGDLGAYRKEKNEDQYVDGPNCPFGITDRVQIHLSNTLMQAVNETDYEVSQLITFFCELM